MPQHRASLNIIIDVVKAMARANLIFMVQASLIIFTYDFNIFL